MKGLQDRNINILAGTTVENKGKLILTEIFPSVQKHDIFSIESQCIESQWHNRKAYIE